MASMSNGVATVAAVPSGLRIESFESSIKGSPATALFGSPMKAVARVSTRAVVARASACEQENRSWNAVKGAAAAAAIALLLSASPVEAREGKAIRKIVNGATEISQEIADGVTEAEKTVQEAADQVPSVPDAQPAINQATSKAQEASDAVGSFVAGKVDAAADKVAPANNVAPGKKKNGLKVPKKVNIMGKLFGSAAPSTARGPNDTVPKKALKGLPKVKKGLQKVNIVGKGFDSGKPWATRKISPPPSDWKYKESEGGFTQRVYNSFKAAGEARDAGVLIRPQ